jgi:hypothetical protein
LYFAQRPRCAAAMRQSRAWTNLQALFNNCNKNAPGLTRHCRHSQEYPTTVARPTGAAVTKALQPAISLGCFVADSGNYECNGNFATIDVQSELQFLTVTRHREMPYLDVAKTPSEKSLRPSSQSRSLPMTAVNLLRMSRRSPLPLLR